MECFELTVQLWRQVNVHFIAIQREREIAIVFAIFSAGFLFVLITAAATATDVFFKKSKVVLFTTATATTTTVATVTIFALDHYHRDHYQGILLISSLGKAYTMDNRSAPT